MQDSREIIVSPMAFHAPKVVNVAHGSTIRDIVHQLYPDTYVMVEIDGVRSPRSVAPVPPVDSHVLISVPLHGGGGGKNPLRTLLTIAVIVAAVVIPQTLPVMTGITSLAGGTISATGMAVAQGFVSSGIMTAGMMLTNAIAPIRFGITGPTTRQTYKDSPTYSIGANQNQENKWGSVPVMLGRHKVYPPLGASSYTELVGSDEYLRMLLVWGYGPLKIEDLKIGDTALTSFDDVDIETREGWSTDTPLTLFPSSVSQTAIGAKLTKAGGRVVRTAEANVDELSVDVAFPRGLVQFDNAGNRTSRTVTLSIQYREVGSGTWASVPTTKPLSVSGTSLGPISLEEGTYSVYVSNPEAKIYIKSGTDSITGSYRIGEYTVSAVGGVTVTDLSPAGCTGLVCSLETRVEWTGLETALRADFYIAVTGGTAGTVTTQTAEFIDKTTSVVRRGFNWKVDNTKQYEIGITRITADTDDDKIVDEVYWTISEASKRPIYIIPATWQ